MFENLLCGLESVIQTVPHSARVEEDQLFDSFNDSQEFKCFRKWESDRAQKFSVRQLNTPFVVKMVISILIIVC